MISLTGAINSPTVIRAGKSLRSNYSRMGITLAKYTSRVTISRESPQVTIHRPRFHRREKIASRAITDAVGTVVYSGSVH